MLEDKQATVMEQDKLSGQWEGAACTLSQEKCKMWVKPLKPILRSQSRDGENRLLQFTFWQQWGKVGRGFIDPRHMVGRAGGGGGGMGVVCVASARPRANLWRKRDTGSCPWPDNGQ